MSTVVEELPVETVQQKKEKKEKKTPVKRIITARSLKRFSESQIRQALELMIEKKLIPDKTDYIKWAKLDQNGLINYLPDYALANVYQTIIFLHDEKKKNAPVLSEKQKSRIKLLKEQPVENIKAVLRNMKLTEEIKKFNSLTKNELIDILNTHPRLKEILIATTLMTEEKKDEREREREEKERQKRREEMLKEVEEKLRREEEEKKKNKDHRKRKAEESEEEEESSEEEDDFVEKKKARK